LLKSKVPRLFSNFSFIKHFRYKPRREYRDPVEFKYTFTSLKIALRFISEIKSNKLHLGPHENFKELVQKAKKKHVETQTAFEETHFGEVELKNLGKIRYNGEISISHFLSSPEDLEVFIEDYWTLLKMRKEE
jgi:hypothetical protein